MSTFVCTVAANGLQIDYLPLSGLVRMPDPACVHSRCNRLSFDYLSLSGSEPDWKHDMFEKTDVEKPSSTTGKD